jgi:tetratricopeptide (TPR) repeat protein
VLASSGVNVTADQLVERVYLPDRRGSLQPELIGASRTYDRLAYRLEPDIRAIRAELGAGRPVLVLQNLGLKRLPIWHYAVVVGFDEETDQLVLRSGTTERLLMSGHRFMDAWDRAGRWAIVMVMPGEFPADPNQDLYLEAAAGLESAGRYDAAMKAYDAAVARWPGAATALLGIGNVHYRRHELEEAEKAYLRLLDLDPGHAVARNNLAQVLLERGDAEAALKEITAARANLTDKRFSQLLRDTEAAIRRSLAAPK